MNLKFKSSKWQPHLETANLAVSPGNASKSEHDILERITSKISGSWKQSPHPPTQTEIFLSCKKLDMSYPITFPFSFSSFLTYLHFLCHFHPSHLFTRLFSHVFTFSFSHLAQDASEGISSFPCHAFARLFVASLPIPPGESRRTRSGWSGSGLGRWEFPRYFQTKPEVRKNHFGIW